MWIPTEFWSFDIGNMITWGFICVAWIVTRAMDWRGVKDHIEVMRTWQEKHDIEATEREKEVRAIEKTIERLAALASTTGRRLTLLEELVLRVQIRIPGQS